MLKSIVMGVFAVALVSWAMGAYNRLVRSRVAMAQAFAALQHMLQSEPVFAELQTAEEVATAWKKINAERLLYKVAYETAVVQYNLAITQIPAAWIAALFGFKSAERRDESKH